MTESRRTKSGKRARDEIDNIPPLPTARVNLLLSSGGVPNTSSVLDEVLSFPERNVIFKNPNLLPKIRTSSFRVCKVKELLCNTSFKLPPHVENINLPQ